MFYSRLGLSALNLILGMLLGLVVLCITPSVQAEGRKLAVVVGVGTYRGNSGLGTLGAAPGNDAANIGRVLRGQGFTVYEMTHAAAKVDGQETQAPNIAYIRDQIDGVLGYPNLGEDDAIIITFSGHGVQFEQLDDQGKKTPKFYFCPADATIEGVQTANDVTEKHHLLPLDELYQQLEKCTASTKLLIVDACRNDPTKPTLKKAALASATLPSLPPPTGGTVAFFSCKPHQESIQDTEAGQGVFTKFLVQGLEGAADQPLANSPADGVVTFAELSAYVANNTYAHVYDKYKLKQSPELRGDFDLNLPLARVMQQELAKVIVSKTTGMKLTLIPAGEFLMGSSPTDVANALKADEYLKEENLKDEQPQHRVRITKPFYIGVYEVTQAEYEKVMQRNPAWFSASGSGKDKIAGVDTKRLPLENISWYDAVEFCNALSVADGLKPYYTLSGIERNDDGSIKSATVTPASRAASAPGASGYRLPSEAQWEYAARAGTTTPFWFGSTNNGKEANIDGNYPFGTQTKGAYLERTTTVGSYRSNPFGLYDTVGNVREWCEDGYDEIAYATRTGVTSDPLNTSAVDRRVLRGGSWYDYARYARSAFRSWGSPDVRYGNAGFRVSRTQ